MTTTGLRAMLRWPRLRFTLLFSFAVGVLIELRSETGKSAMLLRSVLLGLCLTLTFGFFEQWPRRLPSWLERWVVQVVAVGIAVPFASAAIFALTSALGGPAFFHGRDGMQAYARLTGIAIFLAPWAALAALVRQKDAWARHLALEAQVKLLQAQVAPHFLFNTLANVQALVDSGSPQASGVLRSLTAYLRAAVPRLGEVATTLGEELDLVQAYLELMHMRMPDRLEFALQADDAVRALRCPPMTLLTLVENAVRHGIDPSEEGGRIEVEARVRGARCFVRVSDTGAGLRPADAGLGTGLSSLRARLRLAFDGSAQLRVSALQPTGVVAELDLPAELGDR